MRILISVFAQIPAEQITAGIEAFRSDLASGTWHDRHREIFGLCELHLGYYVAIADLT